MNPIIYKNFEAVRAVKELTQEQFAKLLEIPRRTYYNRIRKGGWTPQELKLARQNIHPDLNYLLEHYEEVRNDK